MELEKTFLKRSRTYTFFLQILGLNEEDDKVNKCLFKKLNMIFIHIFSKFNKNNL